MTPPLSFSLRALVAVIAAGLCYLTLAASAHAATYRVTTTADSQDPGCTLAVCSLRDAITAADNGSDPANTITLPAGDYGLSLGELDVSTGAGALTITGDSARTTSIDAQGSSRVFKVDQGANLALANLTVTGGVPTDNSGGGGIYTDGTLTLTDVAVTGNTDPVVWSSSGLGGGLFIDVHSPQVTITDSTFSNNTAADDGGALLAQGQELDITNSTFAGNTADTTTPGTPSYDSAVGGAMEIDRGLTTITNSTIADNNINTVAGETNGGGTAIDGDGGGEGFSGITLTNDIIADNTATGGLANSGITNCDVGPQNSTGVNDDDDASCAAGPNDIHADPHLGSLADNGGQTETMAITASSPAFGAADTALAPSTDQRGDPRPGVPGHGADIGAYELQASADLALAETVAPTSVHVGGSLTYTFTITNHGPDAAVAAHLADTLPGAVTPTGASSSTGACTVSGQTVSCTLADLASGAHATVTVNARAASKGNASNTGTVSSTTIDLNSANNTASATATVAASPTPTPTPSPTPSPAPTPAPKTKPKHKADPAPRAPRLTLTGRLTPHRLQLCEWMSSIGERAPVGCHPGHLHVHYKLNRRARVHITVQRYYQGRWVLLPRSVTRTSRAGRSTFTTGQSFRGQLLAAGRYRFVLIATSGRLRSHVVRLPFTVHGVRMPAPAPVTG